MHERADRSGLRALEQTMVVARVAFLEALRHRLAVLLSVAALLIPAAALWMRELNFGADELRFFTDLIFGGIGMGGTLLAVLATSQLFFNDVERRSLLLVFSRPVSRPAFLLGKYAGVLAVLAVYCCGLSLLAAAVAGWRAHVLGVASPWAAILFGGFTLWLRSAIIAAMTLFVCSYASSAVFSSIAALMLVLAGHLRPFADRQDLPRLWPNLQLFEPAERILPSVGADTAMLALYGLGYIALFAGAAAICFRRREM